MRMRNFEKALKKDNVILPNVRFGGTTTLATATITTANINNEIVATGLFHVLRIPIVAHNVSGSMWVSGNGSYFFIRAKGTTKSGALT